MSTNPVAAGAASAVTVIVTRRVRPGQEAAFERLMGEMTAAARGYPGHLGAQLVKPGAADPEGLPESDAADPQLFHVVFAFDSAEHLRAWQQSPARQLGLAAIAPLTEGVQQVRQLSGLAHWFVEDRGPAVVPPPRWKVAVVTWLGIFPTVLLLFVTVVPLLADWPLVPRTMVVTLLVVLLMTWVVAPRLTRWFRPWLHAGH
ncbi:MAG: hypothetical protein RL722_1304 [Pseudomonadota bacterium]|jgi:antibiotic biosynthesis monooxygenase (ABM) superfamily enzyme